MTKVIYKGIFGSQLYGTHNENSDTDVRQIHQASLDDIILRRSSNVYSEQTNPQKRNDKDDLDFESKELRIFINDCLLGQTYSQDLLHSPRNLWLEYSDTWLEVQSLKHKLVTNQIKPFLCYCKNQRDKYSKKGDKLNELIRLKEILEKENPKTYLSELFQPTDILDFQHISMGKSFNSGSKQYEEMLVCVDSKFPLSRQICDVMKSLNGKIDAFGKRAQKASENNGIDLKATYHAFRVAWELEELLNYGSLQFPLKRKDLLLDMRSGKYDKNFLDYWLVQEIERITDIPNNLPEPDQEFWDNWLLEKYRGKILERCFRNNKETE